MYADFSFLESFRELVGAMQIEKKQHFNFTFLGKLMREKYIEGCRKYGMVKRQQVANHVFYMKYENALPDIHLVR